MSGMLSWNRLQSKLDDPDFNIDEFVNSLNSKDKETLERILYENQDNV